jgi:hypothetical protein
MARARGSCTIVIVQAVKHHIRGRCPLLRNIVDDASANDGVWELTQATQDPNPWTGGLPHR